MAQAARPRPAGEAHLDDEARLAEHRLPRDLRSGVEGGVLQPQRLQQRGQPLELGLGQAAADAADVAQRAVGLSHAQQQGTDVAAAPALAREPAADDELLARVGLDLDPVAGAKARPVGGVKSLGDDALEPALGAHLKQLGAVPDDVVRDLDALARELQGAQALAALRVGELHQGVAVEPQQVEDHVGHGGLASQPRRLRPGGRVHAPLQRGEARQALLVERHDLAVEDRRV